MKGNNMVKSREVFISTPYGSLILLFVFSLTFEFFSGCGLSFSFLVFFLSQCELVHLLFEAIAIGGGEGSSGTASVFGVVVFAVINAIVVLVVVVVVLIPIVQFLLIPSYLSIHLLPSPQYFLIFLLSHMCPVYKEERW